MEESAGRPFCIPPKLIDYLNRGACVLFIGDALDEQGSQSARLAAALVDACGAHCRFCRPKGKCLHPQDCQVPLTCAAQIYKSREGRDQLVDFVIRQVESGPPTSLHRALVELPVRVMITTAYDDRLEAALREADRPFLQVVRDTDVPFDDPGRVQLIRLHGTVSQRERLVLTEDDAVDLFSRLPTVTKILQAHFASKTLLFVGYRLQDPYFRLLYRQVTLPIDRFRRPAFALQWPRDPLSAASWQGQITFIEAEPLPFLTQLVQATQPAVVKAVPIPLPPEPYKFLDYYTREDVAIFFGRDLEADLLLSTVLAHNLTVFYGRSGTGKTSLLRARAIPDLEKSGYQVAYARMLGDPIDEVKAAVRGVSVSKLTPDDTERRLVDVLVNVISPAGRLVVVLDQFEEFTRQHPKVRKAFAAEIAACLEETPSLDLRFLLSLRDDYLGSLDELSDVLAQDVFAHRYRIEALTREKALLAILNPAAAFGLPVEEALREQLIDDLEDQGLEPANLQIVLYRLYRDVVEQGLWDEQKKRGTGLMIERYQALGGTKEILAGYLDEVIVELPSTEEQQGARAILKSMVTAERTKAALSGQEISRGDLVAKIGLGEGQLDKLLAYLREKRVLRKFGDEDRYELAHEVMVERVWDWFGEEERHVLEVHDMLRRELSNYHKFGLLMGQEKLDLVAFCCDELSLGKAEQVLILRSALAAKHKVSFWREQISAEVVKLVLFEGRKVGDLMSREDLELLTACCESLSFHPDELEFILRSTLAIEYQVLDWWQRAILGGLLEAPGRELLKTSPPHIRAALIGFLEQMSLGERRRLSKWIIWLLEDEQPQVRVAAISALAQMGEDFADDIIGLLGDEQPQVRVAAIGALAEMGKDLANDIAGLLGDEQSQVRVAAIDALAGMGKDFANDIVGMLGDEQSQVWRVAAIGALAEMGKDFASNIVGMLGDEHFQVRVAAIGALAEMGKDFANDIVGLLGDEQPQVRVAAINALEWLQPEGAWREHLKHECYIPAGPFIMGDDQGKFDDEKPAHKVTLQAFYIARYPVTNAEYKSYREDVGRPFEIPVGKETHPVVNVSWYDAREYAAWAGLRLLTEAEWEKVASWSPLPTPPPPAAGERGGGRLQGRKHKYPWGDAFDKERCNTFESGIGDTTPVRQYSPAGDSPYGCADMAGNVWEWTSSLKRSYSYRADDGREDAGALGSRVLRGGSFCYSQISARSSARNRSHDPGLVSDYYGFRCGLSPRSLEH